MRKIILTYLILYCHEFLIYLLNPHTKQHGNYPDVEILVKTSYIFFHFNKYTIMDS